MTNDGVYEEKLLCGGRLRVTRVSWEISYFFSYPDAKYNGSFVVVPGEYIHDYIKAFRDNWSFYLQEKAMLSPDAEVVRLGKMNMSIRIGSFREGVCLCDCHMPIANENELCAVVNCYEYAERRALQAQEFLNSL